MKRGYHVLLPEEKTLWVMSINPADTMSGIMRKNIMDDLAETIWEYTHFYPEKNPDYFSISYSHNTIHPFFQPYTIYLLVEKEDIAAIIYYCQDRINIFRKKYGEAVNVQINNPRRATMREISLFSKT